MPQPQGGKRLGGALVPPMAQTPLRALRPLAPIQLPDAQYPAVSLFAISLCTIAPNPINKGTPKMIQEL